MGGPMRYLVVLLMLSGCAPIEVAPDAGTRFTIQHGSDRFDAAMKAATAHCAKLGARAVHLGSDTMSAGSRASRFECAEKK